MRCAFVLVAMVAVLVAAVSAVSVDLRSRRRSPVLSVNDKRLLRRAVLRRNAENSGTATPWQERAAASAAHESSAASKASQRFRGKAVVMPNTGAMQSMYGFGALGSERTWTDVRTCQGCRALMDVVIGSTSSDASVRDIIFAIHSACNDQPEVLTPACLHATHYDANLAVLRQQYEDKAKVCKLGGMCNS